MHLGRLRSAGDPFEDHRTAVVVIGHDFGGGRFLSGHGIHFSDSAHCQTLPPVKDLFLALSAHGHPLFLTDHRSDLGQGEFFY